MVFNFENPFPPSIGSFQVPVVPPDVDPDDGDLAVVCFSLAWLPYILGALQQLTLQASWQGDSDTILLTQQRAMDLLSMFNQGDVSCPGIMIIKNLRYNIDLDLVQQTFDGGSSWVDSPGMDPRHSVIFQFPPLDVEDPTCQAAANMVRFLNNVIDETLSHIAVATGITDMVLILMPLFVELGPFAILIDLVAALASTLLGAGAGAISAAFTNDVYDTLTCIFFCAIESDGTVTAADVTEIQSQVDDQIGGLVSVVIGAMLLLTGEVGLTNEGTLGDAPADCDECECSWCGMVDFTTGLHDWTLVTGTQTNGVGLTQGEVVDGSDVYRYIDAYRGGFDADTSTLDSTEIFFTKSYSGSELVDYIAYKLGAGIPVHPGDDVVTHASSTNTSPFGYTTPTSVDAVRFNIDAGFTHTGVGAGTATVTHIIFTGHGIRPDGLEDC